MAEKAFLAFDLGAESGRAMVGRLDGEQLALHEVHRFPNGLYQLPDGYHWNTLGLYGQLIEGLREAGRYCGANDLQLQSIGIDTWGVDFGLLGRGGQLLGIPYAYRDERNQDAMDDTVATIGVEELYRRTGIQLMPLNTLFQLVAQREADRSVLDGAERLLFTPDLLGYLLTGERVTESTIASTSQMIDPRTGDWDRDLLERLEIPTEMLGPIVRPGHVVGTLRPEVAEAAGVSDAIPVVSVAGHDTASAVAAVPAEPNTDWAYLSSGTWSLMGVELDQPVLTDGACERSFTNEGGIDGTIRFLTNIMGLWLVQETRREYEKQGEAYDYAELTRLAGEAEPFRTLVSPNHGPFLQPGDMPGKIATYARDTDQPVPETAGQFTRCCLESLALTYRRTLEGLQQVLDRKIDVIHIVGGGGKNELLNQMTADATGCRVVVGPDEATAMGNLLVQAMGTGAVADLAALRRVVRASCQPRTFTPGDTEPWDRAAERFEQLSDG